MSGPQFVVVLHRLPLDVHRMRQVASIGLGLVVSTSVRRTLEAMSTATRGCVLVDLGVGGNGPERIGRAMKAHPHMQLVACTTKMNTSLTGRARQLGVDRVFVFPEGALTRIFELAPDVPRLEMRRAAERALVLAELHADALRGTLVNLSATGALIEVQNEDAALEHVTFEFRVPGETAPLSLEGRKVWRGPAGPRTAIGLSFVNVSDEMRAVLARYVTSLNVLRVGRTSTLPTQATATTKKQEKVRVQREGDTRIDYFDLSGDPGDEDGAVLVPRGAFPIWWNVGDTVVVHRPGNRVSLRVAERLQLDPERVDGRTGWRVRR